MARWHHDWPHGVPFWRPAPLIATWFGSGLLRPASGTWGSVAAIPPAFLLVWAGGPWALGLAAIAVFGVGVWAAHVTAAKAGKPDWSAIVVDEVVGVWLALLPVAVDLKYWVLALIAFRVFDIVKIGPVGWADRHAKGGFGIMIDDVIAGIMAAAVMLVIAAMGGIDPCFQGRWWTMPPP